MHRDIQVCAPMQPQRQTFLSKLDNHHFLPEYLHITTTTTIKRALTMQISSNLAMGLIISRSYHHNLENYSSTSFARHSKPLTQWEKARSHRFNFFFNLLQMQLSKKHYSSGQMRINTAGAHNFLLGHTKSHDHLSLVSTPPSAW